MNKKTVDKLLQLNRDFYNNVGPSFSKTRQYGWPGWKILLEYIKDNGLKCNKILDLACGNGRFFKSAVKYFPDIDYLGIDDNEMLLHDAEIENASSRARFINMDLILKYDEIPSDNDLIVLFGFMHHIPSSELRIKVLTSIKDKMGKSSILALSLWDFVGKRYHERSDEKELINEIGIDPLDLELNDHILDWRSGKRAYRYAHSYTEKEIDELMNASGLEMLHSYTSDGRDNTSNRYFITKRKN